MKRKFIFLICPCVSTCSSTFNSSFGIVFDAFVVESEGMERKILLVFCFLFVFFSSSAFNIHNVDTSRCLVGWFVFVF